MKKISLICRLLALLMAATPAASFAADTSVSDLEKRAAQGDVQAQARLGALHASCRGVPCNPDAALKWLSKAADRGSAEAAYDIGNLYVSPVLLLHPDSAVQQDSRTAVKWWQKAAEQGYIPAQRKLGQVYQKGLSVSDFSGKYRRQRDVVRADYAEAMKWYGKAAAQGDDRSAAAIGDIYAKGQGVPQDPVQAYVWYSRSSSVSAARAHNVLNKMSPAQKDEAVRLAKGWKPAAATPVQKAAAPVGEPANPFVKQATTVKPSAAPSTIARPATWKTALSKAGVGDRMPDGTIYLGKFHSIHWFVMAEDAKDKRGQNLLMSHDQAQEYVRNLKAHGHADWTVPDQDTLQQMFGNRNKGAFKGTYSARDDFSSGWYWSSTQNEKFENNVVGQRFSNGNSGWIPASSAFSVRPVRAVAQP